MVGFRRHIFQQIINQWDQTVSLSLLISQFPLWKKKQLVKDKWITETKAFNLTFLYIERMMFCHLIIQTLRINARVMIYVKKLEIYSCLCFYDFPIVFLNVWYFVSLPKTKRQIKKIGPIVFLINEWPT